MKNFFELDLDLKNVSSCIDKKNRFEKWRLSIHFPKFLFHYSYDLFNYNQF